MKIEGDTKDVGVNFSQLEPGDAFRWEDWLYLTMEKCATGKNAVALDDGSPCRFKSNDTVYPRPDAKVVFGDCDG